MNNQPDITIIGAGVIGLTTALRLGSEGVSVTVLERGRFGREASWAGAGMLPPGNLTLATTPEARLRSYSHGLWDELSTSLKSRTGIDNGYLRCGSIEVADTDNLLDNQKAEWDSEGLRVESLTRADLEKRVPGISPEIERAVFLPDFGQARNPRHVKALAAACRQCGVDLIENVSGLSLQEQGDGSICVATPDRTFSSERVCVTAGSWTAQLLQPLGVALPVQPVRGQMVQLRVSQLPFTSVIEQGRRYLVPRPDGLILIGSTEEHVGFEKQNTSEGISGLLQFAESLAPELRHAEVVRSWAGLRPGSPDELPYLGRVPQFENLFVGAGHFRSGLQMSPGTGQILADLLLDREPEIDLTGLTVDRPSQAVATAES